MKNASSIVPQQSSDDSAAGSIAVPPALNLPSNPVSADSSESWNTLLSNIFGSIRAEPQSKKAFQASLAAISIGDVNMIQCKSGAARVQHDPQSMPPAMKNDFIIKVQMQGNSIIRVANNELSLNPGDYLICDNSQPYSLTFEEETTIISVPVAEDYLRKFSPFPADVAFTPVDGANPIHRVAYDYLHSLWRNDVNTMSDFAKARLAETFLELAVLSIADEQRVLIPQKSGHHELYLRCCRYIDQHFADEELSPAQIAEANGVSLRLLQATFSGEGTTVREYVTLRRLQEAMQILKAPIYQSRSISEIAYQSGFKSLASFSRTFKDHYGNAPSEYRVD